MNALPAYLQNKTSRGLAQSLVANLGVGSPPYLSIMGNRLSLIDGVGEEIPVSTYDPTIGPYIDCVVIDSLAVTSKIYYDKPFDPAANQYEPPACWSDNGSAPSRNASKPQSRTCAECPFSAWGSKTSAVSGKGVKACQDYQKLALLVPGFEMPFLLRVPPNSRTNLRGYVGKFVDQQMDTDDVMTRIAFEQGSIGKLTFNAVGWLDEQTVVPLRDKLVAAKATDAMIGRLDQPRQEALPAPAAQEQIAHQPAQGQQPAPFTPAPPAGGLQGPQSTPQTSVGGPAPANTAAQTSEQPQQQRRRRRTNAEIAQAGNLAQGQPAQPQPNGQQQAPFMPPSAAAPLQPSPGAQGTAQPANFGMAAGQAPNPELDSTLNSLFGPPKK